MRRESFRSIVCQQYKGNPETVSHSCGHSKTTKEGSHRQLYVLGRGGRKNAPGELPRLHHRGGRLPQS